MPSNINHTNINVAYPIAGQDNDSQGFRNNFTNIANNLLAAKTEIEDLQGKVLLKSPLNGGVVNNNFNGAVISNVNAVNFTVPHRAITTTSGNIVVSYTNGDFQSVELTGTVTGLSFIDWPAATDVCSSIKLLVKVPSTAFTITLDPAVTIGVNNIPGAAGLIITAPAVGYYLFEFRSITINGTANIIVTTLNWPTV
jgi:hypothetical protein